MGLYGPNPPIRELSVLWEGLTLFYASLLRPPQLTGWRDKCLFQQNTSNKFMGTRKDDDGMTRQATLILYLSLSLSTPTIKLPLYTCIYLTNFGVNSNRLFPTLVKYVNSASRYASNQEQVIWLSIYNMHNTAHQLQKKIIFRPTAEKCTKV